MIEKSLFFFYTKTGDDMELDAVIKARRSIRKYTFQDVSKIIINQIISAGLLAPSAHNRQPWEVVVLKESKQSIVSIMREYGNLHLEDESILKTADTIERCNTLLLVYCNNFEQYDYNLLSMGAMIQNMLLKATDLKVGSVWIANVVPMQEEINQYLKMDSNKKKLVSAVALGYPDCMIKPLTRKKIPEVVTYLDSIED